MFNSILNALLNAEVCLLTYINISKPCTSIQRKVRSYHTSNFSSLRSMLICSIVTHQLSNHVTYLFLIMPTHTFFRLLFHSLCTPYLISISYPLLFLLEKDQTKFNFFPFQRIIIQHPTHIPTQCPLPTSPIFSFATEARPQQNLYHDLHGFLYHILIKLDTTGIGYIKPHAKLTYIKLHAKLTKLSLLSFFIHISEYHRWVQHTT